MKINGRISMLKRVPPLCELLRDKRLTRFYLFFWNFLILVTFFIAIIHSNKKLDMSSLSLHIASMLLWMGFLLFSYRKNQAAIAVAFYLVFLLSMLAERSVFGPILAVSTVVYTVLLISLALINIHFYELFNVNSHKNSLTAFTGLWLVAISIVPLIFLTYYVSFQESLQTEALLAIFQTNNDESIEFIYSFIPFGGVMFFTCVIVLLFIIIWWHKASQIQPVNKIQSVLFILSSLVVAAAFLSGLRLPNYINETKVRYFDELSAFKDTQSKRVQNPIFANKDETEEIYVVVIGESLNKNHMQLYGYPRKTTPKLSKLKSQGELINITNAFSNHTHIMPSLSLALTEASQDGRKDYFNSASLVEIFNSAGFESIWISNQNLLGVWDNLVAIIAKQATRLIALNSSIGETTHTQKFDDEVLPILHRELSKQTQKNRVIFVHLMGNHSNYCKRFPSEYKVFNEKLEMEVFGRKLVEMSGIGNSVNCYDNSVLYNDSVIAGIIDILKEREGEAISLIYFSDHGEDIFQKLGHNSSKFTFEMTQIPTLLWFSDKYKAQYSEKLANLNDNINQYFSNDRIYDTILGLANIKTKFYRMELDLTSKYYRMEEKDLVTLHGAKDYKNPENIFYHQKESFEFLLQNNLDKKFFPHRVNSLGKLKDIWSLGYRSFEMDVVFDYREDGKFVLGHNHPLIGADLEGFLNSIDYAGIEKVWFDFKNLTPQNFKEALAELERLNNIFNIKNKFIVESGITDDQFRVFSQKGWHTSYYLPTEKLAKLFKENNIEELEEVAGAIAEQAVRQQLSAISFDNKNYRFVKDFLEPKLTDNIVYHSWYGPKINSPVFSKEIAENHLYQDGRIKTFLSPYVSNFDL